ncbi:MAG: hypothetical protein A2V93_11840 [Ignavibacteria bacterium RBG_16_34_14]|nr:MAG: hypothetical protein A2V93_11840 [Ignavibacteria bacterium RBG_16_34_14]
MKPPITLLTILICSVFFTNNLTAQSDSSKIKEASFEFPHTLNRLFSVSTSRVMNSLDFSLLLGNSFGFSENTGFLGTLGLGLGGYGDIELGSESLVGSMFNSKDAFTNVGMRIKLLTDGEYLPGLSIGLRTNNEWNSSRNDSRFIFETAEDLFGQGLRTANYDSRLTTLFVALSRTLRPDFNVHLGVSYSDLRFKNVYTVYLTNQIYSNEEEKKDNIFNLFGGLEYQLSNRTILIFEAQSFPYLKVSTQDGTLSAARRVVTGFGIRFFVSKWLLVDSGIRYQDNYTGLADAELRVGLNGIWNAGF